MAFGLIGGLASLATFERKHFLFNKYIELASLDF